MAVASNSAPFHRSNDITVENQSYGLPNGARASHFTKNGELISFVFNNVTTLYEGFQRGKTVSNNGPCLGTRLSHNGPYSWISYSKLSLYYQSTNFHDQVYHGRILVEERFVAFGAGLTNVGIPMGQSSCIALYALNCAEWVIADLSNSAYSRVTVALYNTLGKDTISFIVNQAEIRCLICDSKKIKNVIKVKQLCHQLEYIILFDNCIDDEDKKMANEVGLKLFTMCEIEEKGLSNPTELMPAKPTDLATICYTSGTTGQPKGVMLTHENIISNVSATYLHTEYQNDPCGPQDVHISYLPLAHTMEKVVEGLFFMSGGQIGFYSGDITTLSNDIQELRPTLFVTVPRLLNKMYDKTLSAIRDSRVKKWLFDIAFESKLTDVRRGIISKDTWWDTFVFRKMQIFLGGRVRSIVFGSAPVSNAVKEFVQVAFGCKIYEGYGQTEGTAGLTFTFPFDTDVGHVGTVLPCAHIKLRDVPDMNYLASNGEGEVCFKGPCMTQGYYKNPEKTSELFDEDGWVRTGDVGKWLPNGTLKIIGRKKNIFKLSQGECNIIAPDKIEDICVSSLYIAQIFVYGDSLKDYCVAIIVPDKEILIGWANNNYRKNIIYEDLCHDEVVQNMILQDMTETAKKSGLSSLEIPKCIALSSELFTVDNGLLTPTLKLKRSVARTHFNDLIQLMYVL